MKILIWCTVVILVARSGYAFNPVPEIPKEILIQFEHLNKVLLCLDDDQLTKQTKDPRKHIEIRWKLIDDHPDLKIEYNSVSTCKVKIEKETVPKKILAVVAPKPLELSSRIPMYFFDTPFLNEQDTEEFPNALFPLRNHWQSLKYAFSHYMTTHGWKRMVIVSDDSYYSQAFEAELIEHFKEEFVFDVQRIVKKKDGYSFDSALTYITDNKAYIIIVNIDDANAQTLADAAHRHGMLSNRFLWLVRDWPFEKVKSLKFELMISMTLSPYPAPQYNVSCEHDGPTMNSVWRGLALVSDAVKNVRDKERVDYYYNATYKQMNKTDKCDLSKAFIRKFISGRFADIKSIIIHDSGRIDSPYPKDSALIADDFELPEVCLQRSRSFQSPCNDTYIVIICVVWLMFIIMAIFVVFFFNRCLVWT